MTRLASTAKAGFYPTPERVTEWIARWIEPSATGGRILDPCAGEGLAVQTVAEAWHLESYGIELDAERALAASSRLHRVLHLDYASVRAPHHAFQSLWANPPYSDTDADARRTEYQILRDATKWLQARGVLIYIVPQYRVEARMAGFLTTAYDSIRAFRFPDPEYGAFRQVVIFGLAKKEPTRDEPAALALLQQCRGALPVLPAEPDEDQKYHLPAPTECKFYFRGTDINPQEAMAEAVSLGAWKTPEWESWMQPRRDLDAFRPLMPLKKGHLAMLIAAGMMQNLRLDSAEGTEHLLVKGRTYKVQEAVESDDEDEEVTRDRFVTEIVTLDLDTGASARIAEPAALAEFVEKWRDALAAQVMRTFEPLYAFDLEKEGAQVQQTLDRLSKHRHLPGRRETGLFAAQRHVAVALWKQLQRANSAICIGEPGVGKCLTPESRVQINGQLLALNDIWEQYGDPDSEEWDGEGCWREPKCAIWVPTFDEETGQICHGRVKRLYRQEINEPIRELQLREGKRVRATLSHPFLTPAGWTNVVSAGDYIAVPTRLPHQEELYREIVPPDFLAWQIAEGYEEIDPYCVKIYQKDRQVLERLLSETECFCRILGYNSHPIIRKYPYQRCAFLEMGSKPCARYLIERGYSWGERSAQKTIPPFVMRADRSALRLFLQAYSDAESAVTNRGVEINTASEKLAHQLVELFARFGILAALHPKMASASNSACPKPRTYYRLAITGRAARVFYQNIGFTNQMKLERLQTVCRRHTNSKAETIYVADVVKSFRSACDLGRKLTGNLIGGDQIQGKKKMMNRYSAERFLAFIQDVQSGQLQEHYQSISHRHLRHICRRLERIDRTTLQASQDLLERRLKAEIRFTRVVAVNTVHYQGPVYDLEVEKTHNFIANQIIVHNTTIGSAVSELMRQCDGDSRPTLVLCPPHLVGKWVREIQQIVPMAFAMPLYRLTDVMQFLRQIERLAPGTPAFAVLSREMAKLGSGWRPAYIIRKRYTREQITEEESIVDTEEIFACPRCGYPVHEMEGDHEIALVRHASYFDERKRYCSQCREPLYQMIHLRGANASTDARLFDVTARPTTQRYPIAEFIARRLPGRFKCSWPMRRIR